MKDLWKVLEFVWKVASVLLAFTWKAAVFLLSITLSFIAFWVKVGADLSWGSMIYDLTGIPPTRWDD